MVDTPTPTPKPDDDIVLWIVIAFCLVVPVALSLVTAFSDRWFPPMLLSMLLGIAVAALTYRYLGGSAGSEFSLGLLKVAGSAALLLGTVWLANTGLATQLDVDNAPNKLKAAYRDRDTALAQEKISDQQISVLQAKLQENQRVAGDDLAQSVEKMRPDSPGADKLLDLARRGRGPWGQVVRTVSLHVSVINLPAGQFQSCDDLDLDTRTVVFARTQGELAKVDGKQTGAIEAAFCQLPRKFDVQIGCADGHALFPDKITGCTPKGEALWRSSREYLPIDADVHAN
jgi:hypothetical protein